MTLTDYSWFIVYVVLSGAILLVLSANVSRQRIALKISHGDGGNKAMMKAIRAHANATEYFPFFGFIILAMTYSGASSNMLGGCVLAFTLARILHPIGMLSRHFQLRRLGSALTLVLHAFGCLYLTFTLF